MSKWRKKDVYEAEQFFADKKPWPKLVESKNVHEVNIRERPIQMVDGLVPSVMCNGYLSQVYDSCWVVVRNGEIHVWEDEDFRKVFEEVP
jgi:hypothetical protein